VHLFPGMPPLRAEKEKDSANIREPVEVLLVSSKGRVAPRSLVTSGISPNILASPHLFNDTPSRLHLHMSMLNDLLLKECIELTVKLAPEPMMPIASEAPKPPNALNKMFGALMCFRDTVAMSDDSSPEMFWFVRLHSHSHRLLSSISEHNLLCGDGTLDASEIARAFQVLEETTKASDAGGHWKQNPESSVTGMNQHKSGAGRRP